MSGHATDARMTPRPAKTPAWSHGLLSSAIDDPSSCSDNASDNSDKIESFCQSQQSQGNSNKNRKRKIIGNGGPSFINSSGVNTPAPGGNDGSNNRGQNDPLQQSSKDINSDNARSNMNQGSSIWADADGLAADFDGSLSGLGADLSTSSYDMSEALLALPTIYHHQRTAAAAAAAANNNAQQQNTANNVGTGFLKDSGLTPLASSQVHGGSSVSLPGDFHFDGHPSVQCQQQQQQNNNSSGGATCPNNQPSQEAMHLDCERRFQYVLAAATSVATKVNEETLTYLNQCQPYEIKLKKLGELTSYRGIVFRSVVRLCFHDRRLQFSEREQLSLWEDAHPNDRIMQVDLPLSYGVTLLPPHCEGPSNVVSFLWEPLKEVGLYVKVNCISTEFTPKKHGGEKGVPFRLMIETYSHPDNVRLHAGACQIKVFKLKGADRKHKQDREKIMKKTPGEQSKLQPSYDCTVLSDISLESLDSPPLAIQNQGHQTLLSPSYSSDHPIADSPENNSNSGNSSGNNNNVNHTNNNPQTLPTSGNNGAADTFSAHFSQDSVRRWLIRNHFTAGKALWNFTGVDLIRLGKEELIEICGLPEGIRLYNALHYKITFYILLTNQQNDCKPDGSSSSGVPIVNMGFEGESMYHPICISGPSLPEMTSVVSSLFYNQYPSESLSVERLLLSVNAPTGVTSSRIKVLLTEQLLSTLRDQTVFKAYKNGCDVILEMVE